MNETQTTAPETQTVEAKEPSKWVPRLKKAAKYAGIGIATVGLGGAGFFGMKYYAEHKS